MNLEQRLYVKTLAHPADVRLNTGLILYLQYLGLWLPTGTDIQRQRQSISTSLSNKLLSTRPVQLMPMLQESAVFWRIFETGSLRS